MTATLTQVVKQLQQDWTHQLAPEAIRMAWRASAYRWRERPRDPVTTLQVFWVQRLHGHTAGTPLRPLTTLDVTASASCQARMQLPLTVFQPLLRSGSTAVQHEPLDEGRWWGQRTFGAAGSRWALPDTPALPDHCGPSGTQLPGGGCPLAPLWALLQAGTGRGGQLVVAPLRPHELSQVVGLHPAWRPGASLVADRGFGASPHRALLGQAGVQAVFRIQQQPSGDCTPGRPQVAPGTGGRKGHQGQPRSGGLQQLGEHDQRVHGLTPLAAPQWMDAEQCAHLPERLEVRARQYRVQSKGLRVTTIPRVPTLLEATLDPVAAWAQLYYARWGRATHGAHWKPTMGREVLQGKTVDGVLQELIGFALIDHLVRLVMSQAARRQPVAIDRISCSDAARWLAAVRDDAPRSWLVVHPHRPYRYEPRVRTRRPKPYPLMQTPRQELRKLLANNIDVD